MDNIAVFRSSKSMYLREYEVITDELLKERLFHCLGEILMHHDKHMGANCFCLYLSVTVLNNKI